LENAYSIKNLYQRNYQKTGLVMKVLLTGATGLLGSNIAQKLIESGYQVKALVRPQSNKVAIKDLELEYCFGDIGEETSVLNAVQGCEVVIHAAANTAQGANLQQYKYDNLVGTQNIIKASKRVSRLIYISTAGFFKTIAKEIANEHDLPHNSSQMNSYTRSKFEAQELVMSEIKNHALPAVILNPSFMIGQRDAKPSSGKILLFYLKNKILFYPLGGKNFVDVEDVAQATVNAISKGQIGQSYIVGNQNLSYYNFFEKVSAVSGKRKTKIAIPNNLLKIAGHFGSIYNHYFYKQVALDYTNSLVLTQNYFYDSSRAIKALDLPQTPIENSIDKAIKWFVDNKILSLKAIN
jgi:dihydroflavonol-4-reductase